MIKKPFRNKSFFALGLFFLNTFLIFSQSTFSGLDLNSNNGLLFTEEKKSSYGFTNKNLYYVEIQKNQTGEINSEAAKTSPKLITCYPQKIDSYLNGNLIRIYNKEGIAEYSFETNSLSWLKKNQLAQSTSIPPKTEVSPDGKWTVFFEKTTAAKANIILENIISKEKILLSNNAEYSYAAIPVKWSPNSNFLIYEKNNSLYFIDLREPEKSIDLAENYRKIGIGTINSVHWANEDLLVYINHDMIYKIASNELYTRSLYADMVGNGTITGRLTTPLDNEKDSFVTNKDGNKIVLIQNNKTLQYLEISNTNFSFAKTLFSYPFINLPNGTISFNVFWTPENKGEQLPLVWIEVLKTGKTESYLYKLKKLDSTTSYYFESVSIPPYSSSPKLSPDKKSLSFFDDTALHVYDIYSWKQTAYFSKESVVTYQWINNSTICIGGTETISYWEPFTDNQKVILISQARKYAFDGTTGKILVENPYGTFSYNETNNIWEKSETTISRNSVTQNPFWRVYLDNSKNPDFENGIFVRTLTGLSETRPLLEDFTKIPEAEPSIALVFDALDNADGITYILDILSKYNLKATFFINGEFIRRYPSYVTEIVAGGHECASMFFTTADLTNSSYVVDEEFIRRGLARTEDEFFALTGKELTLYWHTPYYKTTKAIVNGGKQAGYTLIIPTTKQLDMQTLEDTAKNSTTYYSSSKIIEGIFRILKDNAIIPVSVGLSNGTRTDYLYNKIDVLISAIIEKGYKIVPVSELDF